MRRLNRIGALAVKNSAYLLPESEDSVEDFEWLRREIEQSGGEAWLFRCEPMGEMSSEAIREKFRALRSADFAALSDELRAFTQELATEDALGRVQKFKRRYEELCSID